MTEDEWLSTATDLRGMVGCLDDGDGVRGRKLALLAVAFCQRLGPLFLDNRSRAGINYTLARADDPEDLGNHWPAELRRSAPEEACYDAPDAPFGPIQSAAELAYEVSGFLRQGNAGTERLLEVAELGRRTAAADRSGRSGTSEQAIAAYCSLVREVFPNPFRPVPFDPAWRTSTVMALAAGIYKERAFERLPILADALQDAGCDAAAILDHFRDPAATHVRGCWALDLVLGKE